MQTQTVFRAGNSDVVAIPHDIAQEVGLVAGQEILVRKVSDDGILITKSPTKKSKNKVSNEFKSWLSDVLVEDKGILDELAIR